MTWVFIFICVAFSCHGVAKPGDGVYYASKAHCVKAGHAYAKKHKISSGRWEVTCVERDK